jgi:hypothetical protein
LPALILKSVAHALQKLAPAQIGFGAFDALEHLLCRRYFMKEGYVPFNPVNNGSDLIKTNPFGGEEFIEVSVAPTDPQLSYLAVKGLDGNWISILGNYSLHYVGDWENGTISADYFGVFSEELATLLNAGNDFVGMMSNGTSGDVNIWDFLNPDRYPKENFAKSKLIGSDLAGRLVQSLEKVTWQQNPDLSVLYEDIEIEVIKPSVADILAASEIVAAADYENLIVNQEGLKQLYAREQLMLNVSDNKRTCVIQAVKVGSGIIGALSGEFFSETGLYLKNQIDSEHYFTITMANGNAGYVPPAEEIARGGYETWRCRYSCLVPEAEEVLRQKLVALTRSL